MLGKIENLDATTQTGMIVSDGKSYNFALANWIAQVPAEVGDEVYFEVDGGNAAKVDLAAAYLLKSQAVKSRTIATLLALFLGLIGAHRFYLGYYKIGIAQIVVTGLTGGFGAVWGFIEAALIFGGHINKDAKGRPLK